MMRLGQVRNAECGVRNRQVGLLFRIPHSAFHTGVEGL